MDCPNCKQPMQIDGEPTTTYNQTKKRGRHDEYERTHFVCEKCDIWLGVEMPRQRSPEKTSLGAS